MGAGRASPRLFTNEQLTQLEYVALHHIHFIIERDDPSDAMMIESSRQRRLRQTGCCPGVPIFAKILLGMLATAAQNFPRPSVEVRSDFQRATRSTSPGLTGDGRINRSPAHLVDFVDQQTMLRCAATSSVCVLGNCERDVPPSSPAYPASFSVVASAMAAGPMILASRLNRKASYLPSGPAAGCCSADSSAVLSGIDLANQCLHIMV